jgi:hypothetical protein
MLQPLVLSALHTATNADVLRLPWLLGTVPEQVLVRELFYNTVFPLMSVAKGPFVVIEEDDHFVLRGFDSETGAPAKLRVISTEFGDRLQYCNGRYTKWGESPFSNILLLPVEIKQ